MKRALLIIAGVVLLIVLGVAAVLAATFMGRRPATDGQVFNRVRVVAGGFSSLGVITVDDQQVALVDTGDDATGAAILAELTRRKLGPEAVSAIFLTHGHQDHIGAVHLFPRAQVMALEAEVPLIDGTAASRGPLPRFIPVNRTGIIVTRRLSDGDVVTLADLSIRVYAVPGHTAGSAAYVADGALFLGDSADIASDGRLQGAPWIFSDSQAENRASLAQLEHRLIADGVSVRTMIPAHSGAADGLAPLTTFARENR